MDKEATVKARLDGVDEVSRDFGRIKSADLGWIPAADRRIIGCVKDPMELGERVLDYLDVLGRPLCRVRDCLRYDGDDSSGKQAIPDRPRGM